MVLPRPFCRCAKWSIDTIASPGKVDIRVCFMKSFEGAWPSQDKAAAS